MATKPVSKPPKEVQQRVAKETQRLRDLWERGQYLLDKRKPEETLEAFVERMKPSESTDTLYKLLQLADRVNKAELEQLLKLRTPLGLPLTWSHLITLISLDNRAERMKFAKLAADEPLSSTSLRAIMQTKGDRGNRRPGAGRKPLAKTDTREAALRIKRQISRLRKQIDALADEETKILIGPKREAIRQPTDKLLKALKTFEAAMEKTVSSR